MDTVDRLFAETPQRAKPPRCDLEAAMAELLELRAKVRAAARLSGMPPYMREAQSSTSRRNAVQRHNEKPHNRTR